MPEGLIVDFKGVARSHITEFYLADTGYIESVLGFTSGPLIGALCIKDPSIQGLCSFPGFLQSFLGVMQCRFGCKASGCLE